MSETNIHPELEKDRRLALMEEKIRNPVLITDYEGLITWCNPAFTSVMGYSSEEVMGMKLGHFLIGPKTDPAMIEQLNAALMEKRNFDGEIFYYSKNGKGRWFAIATSPILDETNVFIGYFALHTDITERKYAESELLSTKESFEIANQQLESANSQLEDALSQANQMASEAAVASQTKDEFIAHISNEIHHPIRNIVNALDTLSKTSLSPEQNDQIKNIFSGVETLNTIISDISQFHEIESGKCKIEQKTFDLHRCVKGTIDWLQPKASEKNVRIACSIHELTPQNLVGDEKRLRQVFITLLNNALLFTPQGEISVTVKSKSLEDKLREIQFQIQDQGMGIPEEEIKLLLQAFSQTTISSVQGKSVSGLAISKRLAEFMGGNLGIENTKHNGSCFYFSVICESVES